MRLWQHSHQPQKTLTEEAAPHPAPCSQSQLGGDHAIAKNRHEAAFGYGKPYFESLSFQKSAWKPTRAEPTALQGLHSPCTRCGPKGTVSNL